MSVIGLDFGSHTSSIALWYEEKDVVEVLADDLGSRTIPSFVGFRNGEVIVGQSAMSQYHKNPNNTFEDVRALIINPEVTNLSVPILEKEIPVQEIVSHFFRNIHNQIKQQVGKAVRDCVISIPGTLDESSKQRLYEAAQAGGIRIKCIINDSTSTLLAHAFDDETVVAAKVAIVEIGWSKSEVGVYTVSKGLFFPLSEASTTAVSGNVLVNLLADHCAKDFQRKAKFPCSDNKKAMLRLRRECEETMKQLSVSQESTIDIDSLCEGVDFSSKVSRARFEDLCSVPFIHLKNLFTEAMTKAGLVPEDVTHVCLTGGVSAVPKVLSTIKGLFPQAAFPKGKFEAFETQCIGAALHGKSLLQLGLIDKVPIESPTVVGLSRPILLTTSSSAEGALTILPANTVLPASKTVQASVTTAQGYLSVLVGPESPSDSATQVGEVVFDALAVPTTVDVTVSVDLDSSITVVVRAIGALEALASLTISAPK